MAVGIYQKLTARNTCSSAVFSSSFSAANTSSALSFVQPFAWEKCAEQGFKACFNSFIT